MRNPPSNFELQSPETQQKRLLAALRAAKSGTWKWDILEDRVTWDEPLAAIYGVDIGASAKTANEFISFVHPDDRSRIAGLLQSVLENGTDAEYEFRTLLPDGKVAWIYDRSKLIRDESGRPLYMIGACLDVTARKLAEQALINSETRLALATSAAELGIWDWDLTTNEMLYSPRAKEIYGFALELPVTHGQVRAATHTEDLPRTSRMAKNALDPSLRSQEPYEYRIIRPDGSVRWVLAHGQVVFEPAGEASRAVRYVGTIQDITVRRQTETALRDSESRLRLAVDAGRMAIWEYDVATESMVPSPELNKLLGFPTDATPSLEALRSGYHPAEQNLVRNAGAEALARGERFFEVEYRYIRRDNATVRWLLLRAEIQMGEEEKPRRVIGVLLDITDRRQAAERQQLLVNELNHRVKNMLTTVQSITHQTLKHASSLTAGQANIEARLAALARTHDLLTEQGYDSAPIGGIVHRSLSPFAIDRWRLFTQGPDTLLRPRQALDLALVLHELATNAIKYGAWSNREGSVTATWTMDGNGSKRFLHFRWIETGGPPVEPTMRTGFGSRLIKALTNGEAQIALERSGLSCSMTFALSQGDADQHR